MKRYTYQTDVTGEQSCSKAL